MGMPDKMPSEMYPHFSIDLEHLPEAKNWKIGKTYSIELQIKQTSMDMHKDKMGKEMGMVGFDIVGIGVDETKGPEKKERYSA